MVDKAVVWNNGQRRRLKKDEDKPRGKKLAYNEGDTRAEVRRAANTFVNCPDCGDRLLAKNLPWHYEKALKHKKRNRA